MRGSHRRLAAAGAVAALLCLAPPLAAQRLSLGLEGGGVSVDDRRGLQPGFAISLLWPMGRAFAGALSYSQWFPGGPEPALSAAAPQLRLPRLLPEAQRRAL